MPNEQGGAVANRSGKQLEEFIMLVLHQHGYTKIQKSQFNIAKNLDQPIYCRKYPLCKSIYDTQVECDFIIYHPQKHPECLITESKWQQSGGSVDKKFPYLLANIKEKYPHNTIIVLDGGGYKKGAEQWLRNQIGDNLLGVFNMSEFQIWANRGNL